MLFSKYTFSNLVGSRLAHNHVSVTKYSHPQKSYESIKQAISNDPFRSPTKQAIDRVYAVQKALERLHFIGERMTSNYRVSRGDHARMQKEVEYLRNRMHRLVQEGLYKDSMNLTTNDPFYQEENSSSAITRRRLDQLIDGITSGKYQQTPASLVKVLQSAREEYFNRYQGDPLQDLTLRFEGPSRYFSKDVSLEYTINDIRNDLPLSAYRDEDDDIDMNQWAQNAIEQTKQRILANPGKALLSHIEGIEKSGHVLLKLSNL